MNSPEGTISNPIAFAQWSALAPDADDFEFTAWETAQPILLNRYWSGENAPAKRHAEAQIIWSGEALHVRFRCFQQEPLLVAAKPQTSRKTIGLWERDVCELFVAPDPATPHHYFEFEAAPTGEWLDVEILLTEEGRESDWEYVSGFNVATKEVKPHLLISMRIPWSQQIPQPYPGKQWRVNLFRCVGSGVTRGYLAWQPTLTPEPNFHVPAAFGVLQFE